MAPLRAAAALVCLSLAACGGSKGSTSAPPGPGPGPASGWIPVDGMRCADGTGTGIGIARGSVDAVIVYLSPGGACWSTGDCSAILRRFPREYYEWIQGFYGGTIFDRTLAGNPFATWTQVFVPYCTGDVHAGDAVRQYGGVTWQHHGWKNLEAAVMRITAELPRPSRLVVTGSSAGGFGSLAAYGLLRTSWDAAGGTTAALLDDSAQTFDPTGMPSTLLARWWDVWGLGSTIGSSCPSCATDLSAIWPALQERHPGDRLALISTTRDLTMRSYFADPQLGIAPQSAETFEANVNALASQLAGLGPDVATFRVGGASETRHALFTDASFLAGPQGASLLAWITEMLSLDPAWAPSTSP